MEAKQKAVKRDKTFSFNFSKTNENEEKGKGSQGKTEIVANLTDEGGAGQGNGNLSHEEGIAADAKDNGKPGEGNTTGGGDQSESEKRAGNFLYRPVYSGLPREAQP